jgi:hypothetical protein
MGFLLRSGIDSDFNGEVHGIDSYRVYTFMVILTVGNDNRFLKVFGFASAGVISWLSLAQDIQSPNFSKREFPYDTHLADRARAFFCPR